MILEFHTPAPPLDRFVRHFVYFEGYAQEQEADRLLPDGGIDMLFDLSGPPKKLFDNTDLTKYSTLKHSWISGLRTGFVTIDSTASSMFNIHLRAHGAWPFLRLPLTELKDRVVELDCVIGAEASRFRDALLSEPTPAGKFRVAEQRLLALARPDVAGDSVVQFAIDAIDHDPTRAGIGGIVSKTGYSHKHFIHLFETQTGLTPKVYARIMKFQGILESIEKCRMVNWPQLALDCGYYDQPHFIHEFNLFSGINPSDYLLSRGDLRNYLPVRG